jgi:hypothetical protein
MGLRFPLGGSVRSGIEPAESVWQSPPGAEP